MRRTEKAGTVRSVTVAITPSAPRPIRAAGSSSGSEDGETSTRVPSARTSSIASITEERFRKRDPVP